MSEILNKIAKITAALERLEHIVVETWIHEHEHEDAEFAWFPEFARHTIASRAFEELV